MVTLTPRTDIGYGIRRSAAADLPKSFVRTLEYVLTFFVSVLIPMPVLGLTALSLMFFFAVPVFAGPIISVAAVGDMRFNDYIGDTIREHGYEYPFKPVQDILREADIAYGNFECTLTTAQQPVDKKYVFRADPGTAGALTAAGFDILDIANNHSGDYGVEGFIETMRTLREHGLAFVGGGNNISESRKPVMIDKDGLRIAFLSFSNTFPKSFWATADKPGTTPAYLDYIRIDVADAKKKAHIVVVSYHGGDERSDTPKQSQKDIAYAAIDAGASIVFGHHPHVLQGIEIYRGSPVVYSLGNFMFLSLSKECYDTMIVRAYLSREGVETLEIIPVRIDNAFVRKARGEETDRILTKVQQLSHDLGTEIVIKNGRGYLIH